jgi:FAD/FMN-containing dehydrogenase
METKDASRIETWSNWSGSVKCEPSEVVKPCSIEELTTKVGEFGRAGRHMRVVGSGHSFTPIVRSDDVLMSLEAIQGVESIDRERGQVTVLGGTVLKMLGEQLFAQGLAQENLGDIDVQSISGAVSTGTHGTGMQFGTLSTQVEGFTLVTASGEMLECSSEHNPDVFKAAQVSLGTLGVIATLDSVVASNAPDARWFHRWTVPLRTGCWATSGLCHDAYRSVRLPGNVGCALRPHHLCSRLHRKYPFLLA